MRLISSPRLGRRTTNWLTACGAGQGWRKSANDEHAGQTLFKAFLLASFGSKEERAAAHRELQKQLGEFHDRAKEVVAESSRLDKWLDRLNDRLSAGRQQRSAPSPCSHGTSSTAFPPMSCRKSGALRRRQRKKRNDGRGRSRRRGREAPPPRLLRQRGTEPDIVDNSPVTYARYWAALRVKQRHNC